MNPKEGHSLGSIPALTAATDTRGTSPEQTSDIIRISTIKLEGATPKHPNSAKISTIKAEEAFPEPQLSGQSARIHDEQSAVVRAGDTAIASATGTRAPTITSSSGGNDSDIMAAETNETHDLLPISKKRDRPTDLADVVGDDIGNDSGNDSEASKKKRTCPSVEDKTQEGNAAHTEKPVANSGPIEETRDLVSGVPAISPARTIGIFASDSNLSLGIFDDADEDNTFDLEEYRNAAVHDESATPVVRPDLVTAILGSGPKAKIVATPVLTPSCTSNETPPKTEDSLKKKQLKKVLVTRKEQDTAAAILEGKIDLLRILPKDDCNFLAKELWIFTLQQLEFVVDDDDASLKQDPLKVRSRDTLVKKLALSEITSKLTSIHEKANNCAVKEGNDTAKNSADVKCEEPAQSTVPRGSEATAAKANHVTETNSTDVECEEPAQSTIPRGSGATAAKAYHATETKPKGNGETHMKATALSLQNETNGPPMQGRSNSQGNGGVVSVTSSIVEKRKKDDSSSDSRYEDENESIPFNSDICENSRSTGGSHDVALDSTVRACDVDSEANSSERNAEITRTDVGETTDERKAAERKIASWKESVKKWKLQGSTGSDMVQFPLEGPLSLLFPAGTLQFIRSAKLKTAHQFMCLKKTETGLVVDMFRAWRSQCGLRSIGMLSLAKHLLGINARMEMAIKSVPNVDTEKISWMSGAMVVVTGAAKDFIIDHCKLFSASQFVEMRTKFLADKLSDWRDKQGLPKLKGSGKVAMISAWKAGLRDEIEIESSIGKVVAEEDIQTEVEEVVACQPIPKKRKDENVDLKPKKLSKSAESQQKQSLLYKATTTLDALDCDNFFSSLFPEREKIRMFDSIQIRTARQYLNADKGQNSDLLKAVIEMKSKQSDGKVQPTSCIRLLYDWNARVKAKLDELESGKRPVQNTERTRPDDSPKHQNPKKSLPRKAVSDDPFDALSTTSKDFLASMNISTAEQFLLARTSDIANEFIKWRDEMKIVPLKGLGAVASVSGWKKLVRNKASAVGDEALAQLNQAANTKINGDSVTKSSEKKNENKADLGDLGAIAKQDLSLKMATGKLSGHQFSVLSVEEESVFHFELDVRQGPTKADQVYLTYLGSDSASDVAEHKSNERRQDAHDFKEGSLSVLLDLGKVSAPMHGRRSYSTVTCGTIELGNRGVQPRAQDHADEVVLKDSLKLFVMHPLEATSKAAYNREIDGLLHLEDETKQTIDSNTKVSHTEKFRHLPAISREQDMRVVPPLSDGNYNMFEAATKGNVKYFLYLAESIEKGQSVELCFFPGVPFASEWIGCADNKKARNWIRDRISTLSLKELRALHVFLRDEIAPPIVCQMESIARSPGLASGLAIARRRVHWISTLLNEQWQNQSARKVGPNTCRTLPNSYEDLSWNKELLRNFSSDPAWSLDGFANVTMEIEQEINDQFYSDGFNGFAGTRVLWCPLAESLFRRIVQLFAGFSASLEECSSVDELVDKLCCVVSETIKGLQRRAVMGSIGAMKDLVLTFEEGVSYDSNALPSVKEVALQSYTQQYSDAMNLIGEIQIDLPFRSEHQVVATIAKNHLQGESSTRFVSLLDVQRDSIAVDLRWYLDRQILAVVQSAIRCSQTSFPFPSAKGYKDLDQIESKALKAAQTAMADPDLDFFALEYNATNLVPVNQVLLPERLKLSKCRSDYQPHSSQFFLGFVWPILRASGWRLCAGELQSDVVYFPPNCGRSKTKAGRMKKEIMRQAVQLARDTSSLGVGYIPKLTKRLIIKCVTRRQDDRIKTQATESRSPSMLSRSTSVSSALEAFELFLGESLTSDDRIRDSFLLRMVKDVVETISSLFDEIAPQTLFDEEGYCLEEGDRWSDVLGCEYLMRLLFLFPHILKEADLPFRLYDQTVCIVRELMDFLARNHVELFDSSFHLSKEEYENEYAVPSMLSTLMATAFSVEPEMANHFDSRKVDEKSNEIIYPEDRVDLTDFVAGVMDQVVIFRAKQEDVNRKGRRIPLGHPGLVCRHCQGQNGEGKYFFGSIESMTTASTVIEKHLLRCPHVPEATRAKIIASRTSHADQRKGLKAGVQGAFFSRLFDRLRSMRISEDREGDESDFLFLPKPPVDRARHPMQGVNEAPSMSRLDSNIRDVSDGFKSYLDIMDFIQCTEPWKSMESLGEMVEKYYNCLEYGGKIYNTPAMPSHLGSWLYAKVAPRK